MKSLGALEDIKRNLLMQLLDMLGRNNQIVFLTYQHPCWMTRQKVFAVVQFT